MMNYIILQNASACKVRDIPALLTRDWRNWIIDTCKNHGGRVVSIFGFRQNDNVVKLFGVVGIDSRGELRIASTEIEGPSYDCITCELTEAHLFERELFENLGLEPVGHPWLKPVRNFTNYSHYLISGDFVHEVAVGPVHAGVIEPGHFRFQCNGEKVLNLEIQLGYQHRGIEKLMLSANPLKRMLLAESIAGDSSIAHGSAYCRALEGLANRTVTKRARTIRAIALEVERIANHVGDLGALSNDIGFLPPASYFGKLRADFLNLLLLINGNILGRSLLKPGGVRFDIPPQMISEIKERMSAAMIDVNETIDLLLSTSSAVSRLENTGVVSHKTAKEIGLVGVAARACNLQRDVRINYPSGLYRSKNIIIATASSGDVYARTRVRAIETKRSSELIDELLNEIPDEKTLVPISDLEQSSLVVSMVEGWRGEVVHIARTDESGEICQYKIIDPSFHNWTGLEMAMRNGQISDFPLCNKSFNLSYAGYDL